MSFEELLLFQEGSFLHLICFANTLGPVSPAQTLRARHCTAQRAQNLYLSWCDLTFIVYIL